MKTEWKKFLIKDTSQKETLVCRMEKLVFSILPYNLSLNEVENIVVGLTENHFRNENLRFFIQTNFLPRAMTFI